MLLETKGWFTEDQKALWEFVSSIAAMLAAIATFVTVREMRRSRKDALNPDIFIQDKTITIDPSDYNKINFIDDKFYYELFNLGIGSAKHIRIEWHNNFKERITPYKAEMFDPNTEKGIELKYGPYQFVLPLAFDPEKTSVGFAKGNDKGNTRFKIGDNYMRFLMMEAFYKMHHSNEDLIIYDIPESINTQLKISYLNAQNKRKTVIHRVRTGVTLFRKEETLELDSIMFHFHFNPIPTKRS